MKAAIAKTSQQLKGIAQTIPVSRFLHYREFLAALYHAAKAELDQYSYLQFAEDLGFSKTNVLRLIIAGERPLTPKGGTRIADQLELQGNLRKYWLHLVAFNHARKPEEREQHFSRLISARSKLLPSSLDKRQLEYFQEWYYPIIREMAGLHDFQFDPEWIQRQLNFPLRLEQIKKSIDLLLDLGLLKRDAKTGKVERSEEQIRTDSEVQSMAIVSFHQKMLDAAKDSLTRIHERLRDVTSITVCLSPDDIELIKGKIHELMNEILEMERKSKNSEQVYQLNIQLFPFTKTREQKD